VAFSVLSASSIGPQNRVPPLIELVFLFLSAAHSKASSHGTKRLLFSMNSP